MSYVDGTVGVAQATSPDHYIDNLTGQNSAGTTVFRQKVDVNGSLLEELLMEMRTLVANMAGQLPDAAGRMRVTMDAVGSTAMTAAASVPVNLLTNSVTATNTAAQAASLAVNVQNEGGVSAAMNVPALIQTAYAPLRAQITVA